MCTFISAVLSSDADVDAVSDILRAHGRICAAYVHQTARLSEGERICLTTPGHCDCGTPLASHRGEKVAGQDAQWRERMRRKGWSAAKIERAQAQRTEAAERPAGSTTSETVTSLAEWRSLIEAVLGQRTVAWIGLLVESSGRGHDQSALAAPHRQLVRLASLDEAMLANMDEDVIYEFRR